MYVKLFVVRREEEELLRSSKIPNLQTMSSPVGFTFLLCMYTYTSPDLRQQNVRSGAAYNGVSVRVTDAISYPMLLREARIMAFMTSSLCSVRNMCCGREGEKEGEEGGKEGGKERREGGGRGGREEVEKGGRGGKERREG